LPGVVCGGALEGQHGWLCGGFCPKCRQKPGPPWAIHRGGAAVCIRFVMTFV
jgi:hypothetical protein